MLSKYLKFSSLLFAAFVARTPCGQAGGVTEIFLPRYQAEQMAADQPFTDVSLRSGRPGSEEPSGGAGGGEVWFAGRTSLWRWQIADQSVRRFRLMEKASADGRASQVKPFVGDQTALKSLATSRMGMPGLHRILVDQGSGSFLISSTDGIFDVEPASGRILHYPLPENIKPVTTGLFGLGDHIVWTTVDDLIQLDRYGKRLQVTALPAALKSADRVLWSPALKSFWLARGQSLSTLSLLPGAKEKQAWLAPQQLIGITGDHESLFAWTGSAAARFSDTATSTGKSLDTVKVAEARKLNLMSISGPTHAYLFTDGTLEVYDLDSHQREAFELPLPAGRDAALVQSMVMGGPKGRAQVAFLVAGKPRVFSLAKDLSLSTGGASVNGEIQKEK